MSLFLALLIGCAHGPRTSIAGADLYAQVKTLQANGRIVVTANTGQIEVARSQVLVIDGDPPQVYVIADIIENCRGGSPVDDPDCTLALLYNQRFLVRNEAPKPRKRPGEQEEDSPMVKFTIASVAIAAPLTWGVATCEFDGCKWIFGIPLGLDALLFLVVASGVRD